MISAIDIGMGSGMRIDISPSDNTTLSSIASCAYFDSTYLQLSIGYRLQHLFNQKVAAAEKLYELHQRPAIIPTQYLTWLDMVLLVKYPFMLGGFNLYPLVGVEYAPNFTYVDDKGNDLKNLAYVDNEGNELIDTLSAEELQHLNLFYMEVGIGMDFIATLDQRTNAKWYIRVETLFKYNPFLNNYAFSANFLYGCIFPRKNQDRK